MTTPRHVDPWLAGLTHEQQQHHLAELTRRIIAGELTAACTPRCDASLDVDADTVLRPRGQSTWANKQQRRPKSIAVDELGYDEDGRWAPGAAS